MPHLKLVPPAPLQRRPRPFRTEYYGSARDASRHPERFVAVGHACSLRGAARAAFTRLLDMRAQEAVISDESGTVVARLFRQRKGHTISSLGV